MKAMTSVIDLQQPRVPLVRLVKVEIRKMLDTRAGFWLAMSMVILSALITLGVLVVGDLPDLTFGNFFGLMNIPLSLLLPVLAILLVTSEWNQRTAMVTFSLEPKRSRVIIAKFVTAIIAAIAAVAVALAFGAIGNIIAGVLYDAPAGDWHMTTSGLVNSFLIQLIGLLEGFGFAMLLMNSAAAIVLFFILPQLWSVLVQIVPWLREHVQEWADLELAQIPLQGGDWMSGEQWERLAVAFVIWVVVPSVAGLVRLLRSEVK